MVPIDPWLADRFDLIRDIPSVEAAMTDPAAGARLARYLEDPEPWTPPAGVALEHGFAPGPHGPVPVRVFRPAAPTGALLWLHGGGFVLGSVDDTESLIPGYELAARAGVLVVSAGYRLAVGGVRFPVPLDDAVAAWDWLVANDPGDDPARRFIGGASVGAGLGVATTLRLRAAGGPMPRGMLLAYPILHFPVPQLDPPIPDLDRLPAMLRFPEQYQAGIVRNYAGRVSDLPAEVVPGNFDVAGLPEAWIAPSEFDDLRASGELFARQLEEAGVPVHLQLARGMVHGHLGRGPSLDGVHATLEFFAGALRG